MAEILPKSNGQSLKGVEFQYYKIMIPVNFNENESNGRNENACFLHFSLRWVNVFKTTKQLIGWTFGVTFLQISHLKTNTYFT